MQRRRLCPVRAWSAAGLLSSMILAAAPAPANAASPDATAPAETVIVGVLDAKKAGDLSVEIRGQGPGKVRMALRNTTNRRLQIVIPPGLVAGAVGQVQSVGLGTPTNRTGAFGDFRAPAAVAPDAGFRSVAPVGPAGPSVTVPAGQTVDLILPSVCLNFGLPTPMPKDKLELADVDDYSRDPRVRKALRSLATLGTSLGTAQAAVWQVCNGVPFAKMVAEGGKLINAREVALAARFVDLLDASGSAELVSAADLAEGRIVATVEGQGVMAAEAARLQGALAEARVLGLPVRAGEPEANRSGEGPALHLHVMLNGGDAARTRGKVTVRSRVDGRWVALGSAPIVAGSAAAVLDGEGLARALDSALAEAFVSVKVAGRVRGATNLKVENRLPFTLTKVRVKAGDSAGVDFDAIGVGPSRSMIIPIQAANASIDRVELNGL